MLVMSIVLGTFPHPRAPARGFKGRSSWIPLGSAGTVLAAVLRSETWSQDVSASCQSRALAGTHQRHNPAHLSCVQIPFGW